MSRVRLYVPAQRWAGQLALDVAERRHLVDVLRLDTGAEVEVFDGQGGTCQARLVRSGQDCLLEMGLVEHRPEPWPVVILGLALLKGRKLDEVIRMVTELGVDQVQPFTCARTVARPVVDRLDGRYRRWRSIAAQAARQSGRARVPDILPVLDLASVLASPAPGVRLLLHEKVGSVTLSDALGGRGREARTVLVGPEGGFSRQEVDAAGDAGFRAVGLGLPVLRAETAAIAAAVLACAPPAIRHGTDP